ncbi:hypothetical protein CKO36_02835 [Rhabdochromatium marinum]|nr:hypothetical protein [Rhabdochromatium marinum]
MQINPPRVQDSSLDSTQRRDEAYKARAGGPAGAALGALQESLMSRLVERIPGVDLADLQQRKAEDFSPEAIADRIGQFVSKGLENARANGRSDAEVQSLYNSAVQGMEQGLADARETLESLSLLQGTIADQVDETAKRTRDVLAELDPSRGRDQVNVTGRGSVAMSAMEQYKSASSFELQLRTQDGDEVTVRFGQSSEFATSSSAYVDSDGNAAASYSMSRTEQSGYSFSIEGDLSKEETTAIRDLVRDVSQLANDFFDGDVQKALDQAGDMSFDGSQLASFELNMSQSQQYTAAQAYKETQQIEAPPEEQRPGMRLGQLINSMRDLFNRSTLGFLENPADTSAGFMRGLFEQDTRMKEASPDNRERLQAKLEDLLSSVNQPQNKVADSANQANPPNQTE